MIKIKIKAKILVTINSVDNVRNVRVIFGLFNSLVALEEELRYLKQIIEEEKLREFNEGNTVVTGGSSKKVGKGTSFRTSEGTSQDSIVANHDFTGPFNLKLSEDLFENQTTSISPSKPQGTPIPPSHEKQNATALLSRPPVRIPKINLSKSILNIGSEKMSQKECEKQYQYRLNGSGSGESEQESSNFEQNSEQEESSDSDQSSSGSERRLSKPDRRFSKSDRRPSKFKQRFSKSDRSSLKPEQKSKSRRRTSSAHQQSHRRTQKYFNVKDMPKSFKEALRVSEFYLNF
jgi:hypothetical protein